MRVSYAGVTGVLFLITFTAGSVVALIRWQTGLTIVLASVGVLCLTRYRAASTGFAGSLSIIGAALIAFYVYGSIDRAAPVYNQNVSLTVWGIVIVGAVSLLVGLWIAGGDARREPQLKSCDFAGESVFFGAGLCALAISVVNYATGDIPLLSTDVNAARFGGDYGSLGRLWPIAHPLLQISVIAFLLKLRVRKNEAKWVLLGIASAICLVLAGGRSFIVVAVIAFGVLILEITRPSVKLILAAVLIGLVAFGAIGELRALSSSGASEFQRYTAARQLEGWLGSADLSLQTGPRVLSMSIDVQKGEGLHGAFLFGDIGYFVNSEIPRSDHLITTIIGRDPSVIGGSPPSIFGGMYLDFGWVGLALGALLVGLLLAVSRQVMYRRPSIATLIWFSYFAAYIAISGYSYLSVRPSWIVVLLVCTTAGVAGKGSAQVVEFPNSPRSREFLDDRRASVSRTR